MRENMLRKQDTLQTVGGRLNLPTTSICKTDVSRLPKPMSKGYQIDTMPSLSSMPILPRLKTEKTQTERPSTIRTLLGKNTSRIATNHPSKENAADPLLPKDEMQHNAAPYLIFGIYPSCRKIPTFFSVQNLLS